jgi:hypothetical protein
VKKRDAKRRSKADRPVSKRMTRFAPKVNSFAVLTERKLRFWDMPAGEGKRGGVTAEQHSKLLKQVIGPLLPTLRREARGRRIVFIQDNAPVHDKALGDWFGQRDIDLIPNWPVKSPDLNPIENAFAVVKARIGDVLQIYDTKKLKESHARIKAKRDEIAAKMAESTCEAWVGSFHRRLEACIEENGEHTGY